MYLHLVTESCNLLLNLINIVIKVNHCESEACVQEKTTEGYLFNSAQHFRGDRIESSKHY